MMKIIEKLAWNVTEEEYRADPAISYSTLSRFEREGWRKLASLYDRIETPALLFGSAVDCLITDGEEAFKNRFIVCEFPPLSDSLLTITKVLSSMCGDSHRRLDTIPDDTISDIAVANDYYTADKFRDTRIKKVKESCNEYYNLLALAKNKTILSQRDYDDVIACVEELKTNDVTNYLFTPSSDGIEKVFQLKFKAEYKGIPIRCMFDKHLEILKIILNFAA